LALTGPGFDSRHLHKDNDPGLIPWVVVFVWLVGVGIREEGRREVTRRIPAPPQWLVHVVN